MKKVSVVVPVFNAELYIKQCLESIIEQTYYNLEIIIVNDGSSDSSGKICDDYAIIDNRVKVIHNLHHGVSYTRNCGIESASGEYIVFVDADDTIEKNYISILVESTLKYDYDLVLCNIQDVYKYKKIPRKINNCLTESFIQDYSKLLAILRGPCVKLYKKNIIEKHKIFFPVDINVGEDQIFNFNYYKYVVRYKFIDKALYNYCHKNNVMSLSKLRTEDSFNNSLKKITVEKIFLDEMNIRNADVVLSSQAIGIIMNYSVCKNIEGCNYSGFKNRVKKIHSIIGIPFKGITLKRKVICALLNNKLYLLIYIYYKLKYYKNKI